MFYISFHAKNKLVATEPYPACPSIDQSYKPTTPRKLKNIAE